MLMLVNLTLPLVYVSKALPPAWRLSAINFAAFVVKTVLHLSTFTTRHDDDDDDLSTFAGTQNAFLISHDQVVM